jgi:hypothetical protein
MTSLLDVNVWIALAVEEHVHHVAALQWYSAFRNESLAVCRITELGLLLLLTNARVIAGGLVGISRSQIVNITKD